MTIKRPPLKRTDANVKSQYPLPAPGSLWTPIYDQFYASSFGTVRHHPSATKDYDKPWYFLDELIHIKPGMLILYLGEESMMVTHWFLLDSSDQTEIQYYQKINAALALFNNRYVYLLYEDYCDIWKPGKHLRQLSDEEETKNDGIWGQKDQNFLKSPEKG